MNRNRTSIDSIQGRVIGDTLVFGSPCTFITAIGDNLLLSNMNPVEGKAYQIVDFASESFLGTFGNFGAGPGEFLCQEFAGMTADSDTLYAYDISFKHIQVYARKNDSLLYDYSYTIPVVTSELSYFQRIRRLDNGYYVGIPLSGKDKFFALLDSTGKEVCWFGKLPVVGEVEENIDLNVFYGCLHVSGNSIYYGTNHFGYMARYDVLDNGEISLVWENNFSEPHYYLEDSRIRIDRDKNLGGFYGIATVGDFLLATYSGVQNRISLEEPMDYIPRTLFVLNKDGQLLRKLNLDTSGQQLTISEEQNLLFMKCYNPEIGYRAYDLDEILAGL